MSHMSFCTMQCYGDKMTRIMSEHPKETRNILRLKINTHRSWMQACLKIYIFPRQEILIWIIHVHACKVSWSKSLTVSVTAITLMSVLS